MIMSEETALKRPKYHRKWRLLRKSKRQTQYAICDALTSGRTLTSICADPKFPNYQQIQRLLRCDEEFKKEFEIARDIFYMYQGDRLLDIADDSRKEYVERTKSDGTPYKVIKKEAVMRAGLRIDTRKWVLCKMLPKMYGAKELDVSTAAKITGDIKDLIAMVVGVARDSKPVIEAEVLEVKELANESQ